MDARARAHACGKTAARPDSPAPAWAVRVPRLVGLWLVLWALGGWGVSPAHAQGGKRSPAAAASALSESAHWYDGARKRALWINPDEIAEFAPSEPGAGALKASDPRVRKVPGKAKGVRLWRVGKGRRAAEVILKSRVRRPKGRYSPVLHEGPARASRRRALPGGIVVVLDPTWSAQRAQTWLQRRGLSIKRRLAAAPNTFLIDAPAGIESLERANALYESGEVEAAFPDWWSERLAR